MNRLLVILVAASFALTAIAAISDHVVESVPAGASPAAQESTSVPVAAEPPAAGTAGV